MRLGYEEFLTVKELQSYLRIGRNKAYKLVQQNDFPTIRLSNRILIPKNQLCGWLSRYMYKSYNF